MAIEKEGNQSAQGIHFHKLGGNYRTPLYPSRDFNSIRVELMRVDIGEIVVMLLERTEMSTFSSIMWNQRFRREGMRFCVEEYIVKANSVLLRRVVMPSSSLAASLLFVIL